MVLDSVFLELSVIIVVALVIAMIVRLLRQPPIIGYILAGIAVSPYFLNLVKSTESIATFAQMGIAVLLFMVGLNLDPKVIKEVGVVSLLLGAGQIALTFLIGLGITQFFDFTFITSVYIALALTFSSTIVIIKLLSDKGETTSLHGKISIGVLIVQDLVAILALMVISSISGGGDLSSIAMQKFGFGAGLVVALVVVSFFILPYVTKLIAKSQELLLLFSIGWAFALASLFEHAGFSVEIGALLAGVSLSVSPYRYEIGAKMKPLRDFFLLIFFVLLGSQIQLSGVGVWPIVAFSLLALVGKPLIVMGLLGVMGYTKRSGFLTGITLSQISEFSFILLALGVSVGHVPVQALSMVTIVGLISIGFSTYSIMHVKGMYKRFSGRLNIFERKGGKVDEGKFHRDEDYDIILFGYNRVGYDLKKEFRKKKKKFLIVDNNPETILSLAGNGIECRYGDAEDAELLDDLPLNSAKMIISTIPETETNLLLIKRLKAVNKRGIFIAVSHQIEDSLALYKAGATYVITPHFLGGAHTAHLLDRFGFDKANYRKEGVRGERELRERQREGHKDILHERD